MEFNSKIKKAIVWATCGALGKEGFSNIMYHTRFEIYDPLDEKIRKITFTYDTPFKPKRASDITTTFSKKVFRWGRKRILKDMKEALKEGLKEIYNEKK